MLTACGIETSLKLATVIVSTIRLLQQCLPLAVLKQAIAKYLKSNGDPLQQCLPLAVLKLV